MEKLAASYPSHAGWKEPTTSADAAFKIEETGICDWLRKTIPSKLGMGLTAKELAADLAVDKDLVKPRLTELKRQGKVYWPKDESGKYISRGGEHIWVAM